MSLSGQGCAPLLWTGKELIMWGAGDRDYVLC